MGETSKKRKPPNRQPEAKGRQARGRLCSFPNSSSCGPTAVSVTSLGSQSRHLSSRIKSSFLGLASSLTCKEEKEKQTGKRLGEAKPVVTFQKGCHQRGVHKYRAWCSSSLVCTRTVRTPKKKTCTSLLSDMCQDPFFSVSLVNFFLRFSSIQSFYSKPCQSRLSSSHSHTFVSAYQFESTRYSTSTATLR